MGYLHQKKKGMEIMKNVAKYLMSMILAAFVLVLFFGGNAFADSEENYKDLNVINDAKSFNVASASLVTVDESYSDHLEITMEDDTFDKAYIGKSSEIDEDSELIELGEGNVFTIPAKLDGPFVVSFHSKDGWHDTYFNIKNENDLLIYENIDYSAIFSYRVGKDGVTITKYKSSDTEVVIPRIINGEFVTRIGNSAFAWNSDLTNIIISDTVTSIGIDAFTQTGITSITIPDSVKSIEECVFYECTNLSEVILPDGLTSIESRLFLNCSSLKNIEIPKDVTSIGRMAFNGCSSLESIEIPQNVASIGDNAFEGCSSLESINIPKRVTSIGSFAFDGCDIATFYIFRGSYAEEYCKNNNINYKYIDNTKNLNVINDTQSFNVASASLVIIDESFTDQYSDYLEIAMEDDTFDKAYIGKSSEIDEDSELIEIEEGNVFTIPDKLDGPFLVSFHGTDGWHECIFNIKDENDLLIYENLDYSDIYEYTVGDDGVTITKYKSSDTEVVIPKIINGEFVTRIGKQAFAWRSDVTSIIIPDTVTSIGKEAFVKTGITSIIIPESVTSIGEAAFCECSSLKSIDIPKDVTSIGNWAFYECSSLKSIKIPKGVTSIGNSAFDGCSGLESINIPKRVTSIGSFAFDGCDKATIYIFHGSYAEEYCKDYELNYKYIDDSKNLNVINDTQSFNVASASLVTIDESFIDQYSDYLELTMGDDTFDKAFVGESEDIDEDSEMIEIEEGNVFTIPSKLDGAFVVSFHSEKGWYECGFNIKDENELLIYENIDYSSIYNYTVGEDGVTITGYKSTDTEVVIPKIIDGELVTGIGNHAFTFDSYVISISIPDTVTSIGFDAFSQTGITSITIPDSVKSMDNSVFSYCTNLSEVRLPNGITSITEGMFNLCSSLKSIVIPKGVTSIGDNAFDGCSSLESIEIPQGVTSIGDSAFDGCSSLESIDIPEGVTSIGFQAFAECSSLEKIIIPSTVSSIGDNAFYGCDKAKFYVAKGSYAEEYLKKRGISYEYTDPEDPTEDKSEATTEKKSEKDNTKAPSKVKLRSAKNIKGKKIKALWKKVTGAKGYEIQYSTNKKFKKAKTKTTKKTTFVIKKLKKKKTYYVRVRAYKLDAAGKKVPGKWSKVKKVKVSK